MLDVQGCRLSGRRNWNLQAYTQILLTLPKPSKVVSITRWQNVMDSISLRATFF